MVSCIEVAHRFGHPAAGVKRNRCCRFVLYISLECVVHGSSVGHFHCNLEAVSSQFSF